MLKKHRLLNLAVIVAGLVDPGELLANTDEQITKAKEQAMSRKEIMDRIDRWLAACEEENWLEDYELVSKKPIHPLPFCEV